MTSWKDRLVAVPILGPALRFVKRLVYLPIRLVRSLAAALKARRRRNAVLDQVLSEFAESRAEVRRLKHRYAEYYGAIVEQLREQNRRLKQVAEQQERILHMVKPPADVLPLDHPTARLPQAG